MPRKSEAIRSVSVNPKQLIIGILVLGIIIATPLLYSYYRNPNRTSITQTISEFVNDLKAEDGGDTQTVNIPIVNKQIDISVLQRNPQLLMYVGIIFFVFALLIGITLFRSIRS